MSDETQEPIGRREIPEGLVEGLCERLRELCDGEIAEIQNLLVTAATNYNHDKFARECIDGQPKAQKRLIRQFELSVGKTYDLLRQIAPEYETALYALTFLNKKPDMQLVDMERFQIDLLRLEFSASRFLRFYRPKTGAATNIPLEIAVRTLIPAIEDLAQCKATISWHKGSDRVPEPRSVTAMVIVDLLRGNDPSLSSISILNMMEKVRKDPGEHFESPADKVYSHLDQINEVMEMLTHPNISDDEWGDE